MKPPLLPYRVRYFDMGAQQVLVRPHRTRKSCQADAVATLRQGHKQVSCQHWQEDDSWAEDESLNAQLTQIQMHYGNVEQYTALAELSALTLLLSKRLQKAELSLEEKIQLLECMDQVDSVFNLSAR